MNHGGKVKPEIIIIIGIALAAMWVIHLVYSDGKKEDADTVVKGISDIKVRELEVASALKEIKEELDEVNSRVNDIKSTGFTTLTNDLNRQNQAISTIIHNIDKQNSLHGEQINSINHRMKEHDGITKVRIVDKIMFENVHPTPTPIKTLGK